LSFFVPKLYTAIAFDSGGVASGPLTSTFILPLAVGACVALGGNVMADAFGMVAMVAMTPLIAIQVLGLIYIIKQRKHVKNAPVEEIYVEEEIIDTSATADDSDDIIDL
jgi:hypothetical protein